LKIKLSLAYRFSGLLCLFVLITIGVLYLLVSAQNKPINFAHQEKIGTIYQKPLEDVLKHAMKHRIVAQRALNGDRQSAAMISDIQKSIDKSLSDLENTDKIHGEALEFTDEGLRARKRERLTVGNIKSDWSEIKLKFSTLKANESNDLHAVLIADIRGMIAHAGDTSNLVLDPDLDSYYLMDITLLALPQTHDRIQNAIITLEPYVRNRKMNTDDRIKASVFASLMTESDLERIKADFQNVLNEDPKFFGKSPGLTTTLQPMHDKFVLAYQDLIDMTQQIAAGNPPPVEKFITVSNKALEASFDYWHLANTELDTLLTKRIDHFENSKRNMQLGSSLGLLFCIAIAYLFLRNLINNLKSIVKVLNNSNSEVLSASSQSAQSSTLLSEASTEQAASLQETMASLQEISAMVSQNADSAVKAKEAVDLNQSASQEGSRSVDEMLIAINEINNTNSEILSQMENSNKEFGEIVKIISEIGQKTQVINDIVFQTKLLSFNASVEAARAGEHGKGFAVVAEEVGNLAQMSGNAAKEISDMLTDSIKKVNEIVENTKNRVDLLVEIGQDKIVMGQSTAQKCRESLTKINVNVSAVASMITEISHASKEQAQGIQEINKAISQLDQVTQQNSAVAQQGSSQAEELQTEAGSLSSAVGKLIQFIEGHDRNTSDLSSKSSEEVVHFKDQKKIKEKNKQQEFIKAKNESIRAKKTVAHGIPKSSDPNFEEF
jgi:methyl-accepting chemotaxis protein